VGRKKSGNTIAFNLRISPKMDKKLRRYAVKRDGTRSDAARHILEWFFGREHG
jgi:hypothetical protein